MITALLVALIYIAIISVIGWAIISLIPVPAPVKTVIWAVVAVLCLLVLLGAVTGGLPHLGIYR